MLYVIADLHLSTAEGMNKSMEIFGRRWSGYMEKLKKNWTAVVEPEDGVVIPGDISWALSLPEAKDDLHFIDSLPGRKFMSKGNHDFWWSTASKMQQLFEQENISSISLLNNNAHLFEDFILCGTRGWYQDEHCDNMPAGVDFDKLVAREAIRLRLSLDEGRVLQKDHPDKEILAFFHFPPIWNELRCEPLIGILKEYGVKRCYFGHIHGNYAAPTSFVDDGIRYSLISADFLNFSPRPILPEYS